MILLGGSWVVISRVISSVTILITHIRGLITPLITTPEPPSASGLGRVFFRVGFIGFRVLQALTTWIATLRSGTLTLTV